MTAVTWRGSTNRNARGGSEERRRRREFLVRTFRADRSLLRVTRHYDGVEPEVFYAEGEATDIEAYQCEDLTAGGWPAEARHLRTEVEVVPACRCYRCGTLLTVDTVSADRIVPGCQGGTYRRSNIRPACGPCQMSTGGSLGNDRKRARKV